MYVAFVSAPGSLGCEIGKVNQHPDLSTVRIGIIIY